MGLAASDMRSGRRLSFAVVHAESTFKSELSAGDAVRLETEVLEIGNKSISLPIVLSALRMPPSRLKASLSAFS